VIEFNSARQFLNLVHGRLDQSRDGEIHFLVKRHLGGIEGDLSARPRQIPCGLPGQVDGRHVWVSVCTFQGKRCAQNALVVPALWVDIDPPKNVALASEALATWQQQAYRQLVAFKPRPSLIVFSGRGYQVYLLLAEPVRLAGPTRELLSAHVRSLNGALVRDIGGDPAAVDLARVMRLPGTTNPKTGEMCRVICSEGPSYKLEDLTTLLQPEPLKLALGTDRLTPLTPQGGSVSDSAGPMTKARSTGGRISSGIRVRDLRTLPTWTRKLIVGGAWSSATRYRNVAGGPDRSRADMAAVSAMVRADWPMDKIIAAFRRPDWLIGARFRELEKQEGTKRAVRYLAGTLAKARSWLPPRGEDTLR
jgi:hypothetical protein